ncbi:hypothetical protein N7486_007033, partial [Penicillium sp. IBT 16267x]
YTTSKPYLADQLYLYLTSKDAYSTADARRTLLQRIGKHFSKKLCFRVEPEGEEESCLSRAADGNAMKPIVLGEWTSYTLFMLKIPQLHDLFKRHRDWGFWVGEIAYGLHLSDRQVLDDVDTQMVVLPAVMGQNLPGETYWHIRGTRRVGVSKEDVQMGCDRERKVSRFCGVELD